MKGSRVRSKKQQQAAATKGQQLREPAYPPGTEVRIRDYERGWYNGKVKGPREDGR